MITRTYLRPDLAVRYAWKNILYSAICSYLALLFTVHPALPHVQFPTSVVAILGTAMAIILAFRNASAYDRWWEARKVWGGVVNESRTFTRQALTLGDPRTAPGYQLEQMEQLVRNQMAWMHALRMQLRGITDRDQWDRHVGRYLGAALYGRIMAFTNKATHIALHQGRLIKGMNSDKVMDDFSYVQIDDTLTRITDLQGMSERIKNTPLPTPYNYYTLAFLNLFILFLPFAVINTFVEMSMGWLTFPVTITVGWIFYQIYVFGSVKSAPFDNKNTDVALDAICTTIEIDLKQALSDPEVPQPLKPLNGVLM